MKFALLHQTKKFRRIEIKAHSELLHQSKKFRRTEMKAFWHYYSSQKNQALGVSSKNYKMIQKQFIPLRAKWVGRQEI